MSPVFLYIMGYENFNNRRKRHSRGQIPIDDGNVGSGIHAPGYCTCGRPAGRTGRCATCETIDRKERNRNGLSNGGINRTKRIRPRSRKQAGLEAEYSRERASWLPGKKCAVFPHLDATEIHHKKGRRGYANKEKRFLGIPLLLDKDHWLAVSESGHKKITNESTWAFRMGFTEIRSN